MRISSHIDVYGPSEDDYRLFIENSMTYVFDSSRPPYLCPSGGHKHGVSINSLINLGKTFLQISPARNIAQTWIFATLFEYSSSFSSLILDLICWMVLMMVWQWKPAIKEKSKIQHIKKEWNHLTLKTHCKNKELIYCISGRNASEKELDLQINWYWINMGYSPAQEKKVGKNSCSGVLWFSNARNTAYLI